MFFFFFGWNSVKGVQRVRLRRKCVWALRGERRLRRLLFSGLLRKKMVSNFRRSRVLLFFTRVVSGGCVVQR